MNRKIAGTAFAVAVLCAFPVVLLAEDVSLDTLTVWVKEIAYEQDRQFERTDALEERIEALEERVAFLSSVVTATPIASSADPAPASPPPPGAGDSTIPAEPPTRFPVPSLQAYPTYNTLGSIEVEWNAVRPSWDSLTTSVGYELQVRSPGQQWRTINHSRPYIDSFTHTGLEDGLTYYYRVRTIPYLEKPGRWSTTVWARTLRPTDISLPTPTPSP